MQQSSILLLLVLFISIFSCTKEEVVENEEVEATLSATLVLPDNPYNYADLNLPDHIANNGQLAVYAANNIPSYNLTTDEGAALGRVLFYDRRLSEDNTISCSSCHSQENAFSDPQRFSEGINGHITARNSMNLLNMRYFKDYFWDMSANGLENQVLIPIENPEEMDSELGSLIDELSSFPEYGPLFETAFGDPEITEQRISYSLAQFIRSMVSFDSKFDQGYSNEFSNFTQLELDGKDLFFGGVVRCNQCHSGLNFFTRLEPMMNGLESEPVDLGNFLETGSNSNIGQFKVASLRNVELTAPYMHDGRFETLEEVIEHYNSGVQSHPNLDSRLTVEYVDGGTPLQLNLTEYQKESLVAFLKTLTDHTVIQDERFSDPFVYE